MSFAERFRGTMHAVHNDFLESLPTDSNIDTCAADIVNTFGRSHELINPNNLVAPEKIALRTYKALGFRGLDTFLDNPNSSDKGK